MGTIRNPIEWSAEQIGAASEHLGSVGKAVRGNVHPTPEIRTIEIGDLKAALRKGAEDFGACRTDAVFICLLYPLIGVVLVWMAFDFALLPLIFPMMAGFVLLGPVAAIGLYEMSRRRGAGEEPGWASAFGLVASPSFGAILTLGIGLLAVFVIWLGVAITIYNETLGPEPPSSVGAFVSAVMLSAPGWVMIIVGCGVGFLFAALVLASSVVSFPMLVDRPVGVRIAVETSLRVTAKNPRVIALWGLIVAGGLVIGTLPLFLGLIFVMPILGHATWHLYRAAVRFEAAD